MLDGFLTIVWHPVFPLSPDWHHAFLDGVEAAPIPKGTVRLGGPSMNSQVDATFLAYPASRHETIFGGSPTSNIGPGDLLTRTNYFALVACDFADPEVSDAQVSFAANSVAISGHHPQRFGIRAPTTINLISNVISIIQVLSRSTGTGGGLPPASDTNQNEVKSSGSFFERYGQL